MGGSNKKKKGSTAPPNPSSSRLATKLTHLSNSQLVAKTTTTPSVIANRTRNNALSSNLNINPSSQASYHLSIPSPQNHVPDSVFVSPTGIRQHNNTNVPDHVIQTTPSIGHDDSLYETLLTQSTMFSSTTALESTIINFTRDHVWPKLKLITRGKDDAVLEYSEQNGTLCELVLNGCNIPHQKWKQWWPNTKRIVARTITGLRNNKVAAMRKAFFGMLLTIVYFFF